MQLSESKETLEKKLNIVIMGFGELWQWFYDILKGTNSNVYVVSVSGKNDKIYKESNIVPYNRYEWFPISYDAIDAVLLCWRTDQLDDIKTLIPKKIFPKIINKVVSFQNGFGVKEKLIQVFGKSPARCIPNLSFKRYDGTTINLNFAKTSPIKWDKHIQNLMDTINTYTTQKYGKVAFEAVNSIALHRAWEYKAFMNTILNSLCVVYKWDVSSAIHQFTAEFGQNALDIWSKEISEVLNMGLHPILITNTGEVNHYLHQMIEKFAHEKPSTYNQYYKSSLLRGKVLSEDEHLLGYIIQQAKKYAIDAPISTELWQRMKNIERDINASLQNPIEKIS